MEHGAITIPSWAIEPDAIEGTDVTVLMMSGGQFKNGLPLTRKLLIDRKPALRATQSGRSALVAHAAFQAAAVAINGAACSRYRDYDAFAHLTILLAW
jgi:phosphoribosylaminoimidazole (AIR) synthetase